MPMFPFRRRRALPQTQRPDTEQLQTELNEAIKKLVQFSAILRQELAVSSDEEDRLKPPDKTPQE